MIWILKQSKVGPETESQDPTERIISKMRLLELFECLMVVV
jgi:hypothetical protein